jgi:NAD(P)-dependent dehydrogenase (short-subunit alcohol dehydrogenase family)
MADSVAQTTVNDIKAAGGEAVANTESVAEMRGAQSMFQQAMDTYGALHGVIEPAGILRDAMFHRMTEEEWDAVIQVHLRGSFNICRTCIQHFRDQEDGTFALFTSTSGLVGNIGQANYAAAKMGIVGLTYSCANALAGYGVTANCIAPVAFTRMTESLQGKSTVMDYSPDNVRLSAQNVVPPVIYVASERSDWLTGRVIQCGNGRIGLFSNPVVTREVVTDGLWDLDTAFTEMETAFQEAILRPNPFAPRG